MTPVASLSRSGARGGAFVLASQVSALALRLAGVLALARLISPEFFGYVAISSAIVTLTMPIVGLGLPIAALQTESLTQAAKSSLFAANTGLGAITALVIFALAPVFGELYNSPAVGTATAWVALVPLSMGLAAQFRTEAQRSLRFGGLALVDALSTAVSVGAAIALAGLYEAPLAALIVLAVGPSILSAIGSVPVSKWLPGKPGDVDQTLALARIGVRIFGSNLLRNAARSSIIPISALTLSARDIGYLDRAQQLAIIPINAFVDALQSVAVPVLSRLRDEPRRMAEYTSRLQLMVGYFLAGAAALIVPLGSDLVVLLMGERWSPAGLLLQILAVGLFFRGTSQTLAWLFVASGSTRQALVFSTWSQPSIVLVTLIGIPFGVVGIAVSNTVAWVAYSFAATVVAARASGIRAQPLIINSARVLLGFALPVGLCTSVATAFDLTAWLTIVLGAILAIAAASAVIALSPAVRRDLAQVLATIRLALGRGGP